MPVPSSAAELAEKGIEIERAPCALCGTDGGTPVVVGRDSKHDIPGFFQVVKCDRCGLLRTDPRPTRASIHPYYPDDYRAYHTAPHMPRGISRWFDRRVSPMPPTSPPGRLLEIGTAFGTFLARAKADGWQVAGIELNERAAARAAALTGGHIHAGSIESADFAPGSFDVVCAWHVIEHLHDPVSGLRRCFDWLAPGGWLAVGVPDAGSWAFRTFKDSWFPLDVPRHLYHFSEETATAMFDACGFSDIRTIRPRTAYDTFLSAAGALEDRQWLARGRGEAAMATLPMRVLGAGVGLVAPFTGLTGIFAMHGRRPA